MKTYWDLTEKQRSELSREEVEKYLDAELMTKGVLKVRPLVFEEVTNRIAPSHAVHRIRGSNYYRSDIAFDSRAEAEQFLALKPLIIASTYEDGGQVEFFAPIAEPEIIVERILSSNERDANRAALKQQCAIDKENEERKRKHEEESKKQEDALRGLWEDWYECQRKAHHMKRVQETYDEYVKMAGDQRIATKFLLRVFTQEEIKDAAQWFGLTIDVHHPDLRA